MHFIKLELNDENGQLLSDNFYWRSNKPGDYKALNNLPKAKLRTTSSLVDSNGKKGLKQRSKMWDHQSLLLFTYRLFALLMVSVYYLL